MIFPHGLYIDEIDKNASFFLGHKNRAGRNIAVMAGLVVFRSCFVHNRVTTFSWIIVVVSYISMLMFWSATSLVAFSVFIILVLFYRKKKITKFLNVYTIITFSIITTIVFIFFQAQYIFSFLIEDILQRNLTFTGRMIVWDRVLYYQSLSPWIGWGYQSSFILLSRLGLTHTHNTWLSIIYSGGWLNLFFYVSFLIYYGRKVNRINTQSGNILLFLMVFYGIFFITEVMPYNLEGLLYVILLFGYNLDKFKLANIKAANQ